MRAKVRIAVILLAATALASCSVFGSKNKTDTGGRRSGGLFKSSKAVAGIGVNSFLWRAALETIEFMPLTSADPYGGVIITGWYSESSTPNERFKATVYILDTRLRADAIKVAVFKQTQSDNGNWINADVDPDTEVQIENAILTRARELKISTLG
ncbi:MAG: hypothetical protein COA84_02345 [Robiginitomaculum sp.]|nr:MAG: hypothetical protein COA84_02345 [Robiginitomaculum sp.]